MTSTPAQRKAHAAFEERLKAAGGSKITVRLSPEGTKRLADLAAAHGSREKAFEALLTKAANPAPAENPAPPASVTRGGKRGAPSGASEPKKRAQATTPAAKPTKAAGEPESRVAAGVPYVEDVVQKPYQKGQTKGSKR